MPTSSACVTAKPAMAQKTSDAWRWDNGALDYQRLKLTELVSCHVALATSNYLERSQA